MAYKSRGVVAFDLAGAEYNYPAKKHKDAFYHRHQQEHERPPSTRARRTARSPSTRPCTTATLDRIGHGTRLFEDRDLMEYVRDFRIPIEICLTSNERTARSRASPSTRCGQYFD